MASKTIITTSINVLRFKSVLVSALAAHQVCPAASIGVKYLTIWRWLLAFLVLTVKLDLVSIPDWIFAKSFADKRSCKDCPMQSVDSLSKTIMASAL